MSRSQALLKLPDRAMCRAPMSLALIRDNARGNWFEVRGRYFARVSLGPRLRCAKKLQHAQSPAVADKLAARIAALIGRFRMSSQYDIAIAEKLVARACAADDRGMADLEKIVEGLVLGVERISSPTPSAFAISTERLPSATTFRSIFERWVSGELARAYPDHIRDKRSAKQDEHRANKHVLDAHVADGTRFGEVPIADIRLEHCERVMAALPPSLSRASRRHVAQLLHRVLGISVYPLRLIANNPLPRGFLPSKRVPLAKSYLFPDEERTLLACAEVPIEHRMLYGFLAREGMRKPSLPTCVRQVRLPSLV